MNELRPLPYGTKKRIVPLDRIFYISYRKGDAPEVVIQNLQGGFSEVFLDTPEEVEQIINALRLASQKAFTK